MSEPEWATDASGNVIEPKVIPPVSAEGAEEQPERTRRRGGRRGSTPRAPAGRPESAIFRLGTEPCSDLGNAERLVFWHGADLRYCEELGGWLAFDGRRWARGLPIAEQRAKGTVRRMLAEAYELAGRSRGAKVRAEGSEDEEAAGAEASRAGRDLQWAKKSQSAKALSAILQTARSEPSIIAAPDYFDKDQHLFNCLNGTINLRTGEIRPHARDDLQTKIAPVLYQPDAEMDLWAELLDHISGGDPEVAAFVQRYAGYTLTGRTSEDAHLFMRGSEGSGKSTLVASVAATLGEYAAAGDVETFLAQANVRSGSAPTPDLAKLPGVRMLTLSEIDEGRRIAPGRFKALTGGERITARQLHLKPFDFLPQFKIWLTCNHLPKIPHDDGGLWRRIYILQVPRLPPEKKRPVIREILTNPVIGGPTILAWAVRGAVEYLSGGLRPPDAVRAHTERYRLSQDITGAFLAARMVEESGSFVLSSRMREIYEQWCKDTGREPESKEKFHEAMRARGFTCKDKKLRTGDVRKAWFDLKEPNPVELDAMGVE